MLEPSKAHLGYREISMTKPGRNLESWKLPDWAIKFLESQPETGMQYQTGDVVLKDGSVFHDVVFVGSSFISEVKGHEEIPFDPHNIKVIKLTHKKWTFR